MLPLQKVLKGNSVQETLTPVSYSKQHFPQAIVCHLGQIGRTIGLKEKGNSQKGCYRAPQGLELQTTAVVDFISGWETVNQVYKTTHLILFYWNDLGFGTGKHSEESVGQDLMTKHNLMA